MKDLILLLLNKNYNLTIKKLEGSYNQVKIELEYNKYEEVYSVQQILPVDHIVEEKITGCILYCVGELDELRLKRQEIQKEVGRGLAAPKSNGGFFL